MSKDGDIVNDFINGVCEALLNDMIKEAELHGKIAKRTFQKHDNIDDMHAMQHWQATARWLKTKRKSLARK